ncbi:hypothetical protein C5O22_02345 [Treponema sp. J25]|nr:hypothetical protein C5O22_02345 [Treponema sp. J25]
MGEPGVGGAPDRLSRGLWAVGRAGRPAWGEMSRRRRKQARGGSRGGRCGGMRAELRGGDAVLPLWMVGGYRA